jgi:hypothetical protein
MDTEIERCFESASQLINDTHMASYVFEDWGKGRIKGCGCSPDAFLQMAIQLAYYKVPFSIILQSKAKLLLIFSRIVTWCPVSEILWILHILKARRIGLNAICVKILKIHGLLLKIGDAAFQKNNAKFVSYKNFFFCETK